MSDVKQYLCAGCKAPLNFDIETQGWKCGHCFTKYTKEEIESLYPEENTNDSKNTTTSNSEHKIEHEMNSYRCSNCGAEVLADDNTSATFCIYCKSPAIIKSRFEGKFEPQSIIPFKIQKKEVEELYFDWIKKKKFAPDKFKYKDEIDKITGLYVPFWLFSSLTKGHLEAKCKKIIRWSDSSYDYKETSNYKVIRDGVATYENTPIDGLKNLENDLIKKIEPFNYKDMVDFSMTYMAGFLADRYDVSDAEAEKLAKKRMEEFMEESLRAELSSYSKSSVTKKSMQIDIQSKKYALLPIYILVNEYDGEKYKFIANGQTGVIFGLTPIVKSKVFFTGFKIFVISSLIVALGGVLFG